MKKIFTLVLLSIFAFSFASSNTNEKLTCPTASATVSSSTICSGETTGIALTSNVAGTTYTWQVIPNNLLGASSGSGNAINQTLAVLNRNYPGTVDYIITPFADNCTGTPIQVTITVNPVPEIFGPTAPQYTCNGYSSDLVISPDLPGTSISWTVVQNGVNGAFNGSATETTPGAGIPINQILTTTGNTQGSVTYTIVPIYNGCSATPITVNYTVSPIPSMNATPSNQTINSGNATNIAFSSSVAGTTYSWTATTSNVTGATTGNGSMIAQTLSLINSSQSGSVIYRITPRVNDCPGTPINVSVTVNPNLGTNDFNSQNFILSPNPVTDILNIKNNQTINKVNAFNQLGQLVLQKEYNSNEVQLDFSALKTGIYFISVDSDKKQSTFKIVKN